MKNKGSKSGCDLAEAASVSKYQEALIRWFQENGKTYPWRLTTDPYAVLVSESMLQQTRIATVLERKYFERWMQRFPTIASLASAEESEILKMWEGLGYYNRARNLKKAAKFIIDEHGGRFPREEAAILALPGVGRYTAGAVSSFAFDRRGVIVDGNVSRVVSRLHGFAEAVDSSSGVKQIWQLADRLTPESSARVYNSAIMELGQRVCLKSQPACPLCPVSKWCAARVCGIAEDLPIKKARQKVVKKVERVALLVENGKIFLTKEAGNRRKGLWRLPELTEEEAADCEEVSRFNYAITRYRVNLIIYLIRGAGAIQTGETAGRKWFPIEPMENLPALGSPYRKAILQFLSRTEGLD